MANEILLAKIYTWEANGYDDSDWDTIYFNIASGEIMHDFGTTRGYCPSSLPRDAKVISLKEAFDKNLVSEKVVRDAYAADTFKTGKVGWSLNNFMYNISDLYFPIVSNATRGFKGEGILLGIEYSSSYDIFGREVERVRGICYDPKKKTIVKMRMSYLSLTDEAIKKISDNFINNATIAQISSYIGSRSSCSRFSSDWVAKEVVNFAKGLFPVVNIENAEDKTERKIHKTSARYLRAKEKVDERSARYRAWVNTLNETPERREEIFQRTMLKYCAKEMAIVDAAVD